MERVLFLISALPVYLLGNFIYKQDRNKEPAKLLTKLFIAGILSCFLVIVLSLILEMFFPILGSDPETLNKLELVIYVFVGIALVEELCKWIMTYFIAYNHSEFEEAYDMIIYATFVSLGFAFFENLLYVFAGGIQIGILRGLLAVPGHACDGVFMGYYLGQAKIESVKRNNLNFKKNIFLSLLIPVILHGIYDYCLYANSYIFLVIFIIFVIAVFRITFIKVKKEALLNKKFKFKNNFCSNCGRKVDSPFCPECGKKNE